jgi:dihydroflavonol-4-reductase
MVADAHDVRILFRPTSTLTSLEGLQVTPVIGDVTDVESVRRAVRDRDCVVHAAADTNYWRQDPERQMRVNVEGTRNVAQACRVERVARLLHVSSVAAVGIPTDPAQPASEEFQFNLQNSGLIYHLSKRRAEDEVMEETKRGLGAVIVNPASVTGPQRIAGLIASARRAYLVPCFSGGNCVVDVSDVVQGIASAMERGRVGERYILGGENLTFRAMAEKAAAALNLSRRFVSIPPALTGLAAAVWEPWARWRNRPPKFAYMVHYCANRFMFYDSGKARRELNYEPRDFDAMLREALSSRS